MKHFAQLASTAVAVAMIAVATPGSGAMRLHAPYIGGPTTQIECPGGNFVCTVKNGKKVCTCGGPISQ